MSKMFKYMCLLVISVFCISSISPSLVVFADDSLSGNSKATFSEMVVEVDLVDEEQLENGSSVWFGDAQVNILNDEVIEVVNPDGSVDTIERRADGVYINGLFYMAYQSNRIDSNIAFRAYNPSAWNYVTTVHGNKLANSFTNFMVGSGLSLGLGAIGAALGGPWGAIIGVAHWGVQAYEAWLDSRSPYPYYITDSYINLSQRKWKFVTKFYKNSDYTGYVKTETTYTNF